MAELSLRSVLLERSNRTHDLNTHKILQCKTIIEILTKGVVDMVTNC